MKEKEIQMQAKEWLKKQTGQYTPSVIFLAVLNAVATVLSLAFAFLVRYLINGARDQNTQTIWVFSGVIVGVVLLKIALTTCSQYAAEKLRAKITATLRTTLFGKILRSQYMQTQGFHSGDLLNRLTSDIHEIANDTVGLLPTLVGMIVQAMGAIVALLFIDPLFTAIYVVCGIVFGGITAIFKKQIKKRQADVLETDGHARAFMQEGIASILTVKAYGGEEQVTAKAKILTDTYYEKRMKRNVLQSLMRAMFNVLGNFGLIFAVIWCSVSVLQGSVDYGSMLSVVLLLMQLQQPFAGISSWLPIYYARITSGERLSVLDAMPCEEIMPTQVCDAYKHLAEIRLQNVHFTYDRAAVLSGANASIPMGKIICLTGESGGGKSTIFKLLLNVISPSEGAIDLVDTQGARTPLTAKERKLFAYVPQGEFLFSGTIYENLTFFTQEQVDIDEITKALHIACADFVWDLPQGLQTLLLEGGAGLSEGQMQRLAVARAILSNRPILLLDEATSALDMQTEAQLLKNIRSLQDKTCLIVTHRPAALEIADCVLQMKDGQIV